VRSSRCIVTGRTTNADVDAGDVRTAAGEISFTVANDDDNYRPNYTRNVAGGNVSCGLAVWSSQCRQFVEFPRHPLTHLLTRAIDSNLWLCCSPADFCRPSVHTALTTLDDVHLTTGRLSCRVCVHCVVFLWALLCELNKTVMMINTEIRKDHA